MQNTSDNNSWNSFIGFTIFNTTRRFMFSMRAAAICSCNTYLCVSVSALCTQAWKHTYIHSAAPSSPPDHLESTLKCNNERGNKLIIPISSLLMQASSTVFLIILLFQRRPLGIADCSCTPHTVMTTLVRKHLAMHNGILGFCCFFFLSLSLASSSSVCLSS